MTNEPTTGEIVRDLRLKTEYGLKLTNGEFSENDFVTTLAADRLEGQETKLKLLNGDDFDVIDIPAALAYLESVDEILPHASALIDLIQSLRGSAIELTARAEIAEAERDAAKADCETALKAVSNYSVCHLCQFVGRDGFCARKGIGIGCKPKWRGLPREGEGNK